MQPAINRFLIHLGLMLIIGSIDFISVSCALTGSDENSYYPVTRSNTYQTGDPSEQIYHIDTKGNVDLTYTLNLGSNEKDVYFILTNTKVSPSLDYPVITAFNNQPAPVPYHARPKASANSPVADHSPPGPSWIPDIPAISRFNQQLPAGQLAKKKRSSTALASHQSKQAPLFDTVGATSSFKAFTPNGINNLVNIQATCRKIVNANEENRILNIWVADDCANLITDRMLDVMADKFLLPGPANDIYNYVTQIFGKEWGEHSYPGDLIDPLTNQITILLYHIDANADPGGFLGLFWSKDNWRATTQPESNERLMLYIDAANYAYGGENGDWQESDEYPDAIISTLAHELQHMIHYYQRNILNNRASSVWLNELCSVVTEDLVSYYALTKGPRGITGTDNSPGEPVNFLGRLTEYQYNNYSLTSWMGSTTDYAVAYGFGAYLARNFGHALLFRHIMQSIKNDSDAINEALAKTGFPDETFASVLCKWGAANLLSDLTILPEAYHNYYYNKGAYWWDCTLDPDTTPFTYHLGSINIKNYSYNYISAPLSYTSENFPAAEKQPATSNLYYHAGANLTGTLKWGFKLERGTFLTVLLR